MKFARHHPGFFTISENFVIILRKFIDSLSVDGKTNGFVLCKIAKEPSSG